MRACPATAGFYCIIVSYYEVLIFAGGREIPCFCEERFLGAMEDRQGAAFVTFGECRLVYGMLVRGLLREI